MRTNPNLRTVGIVLVVIGAVALLAQLLPGSAGNWLWPFFVLIPGLLMFAAATMLGRDLAALAIPGSIVTAIGAILFYQNVTGRFESWAYAWGLIPAAVGLGLIVSGRLTDDGEQRRAGRTLAVIGLAMFAGFGLFFELFVFQGFISGAVGRWLLPLLLLGGGAALLLLRGNRAKPPATERERPPA